MVLRSVPMPASAKPSNTTVVPPSGVATVPENVVDVLVVFKVLTVVAEPNWNDSVLRPVMEFFNFNKSAFEPP